MVWSQTDGIGAISLAGEVIGGLYTFERRNYWIQWSMALRKGGGMPEHDDSAGEPAEEHARPVVTRRDFIAGAGLGVAATAIVAGGGAVATRPGVQPAPATQPVV